MCWLMTFCKRELPPDRHPGPAATLARSEVVSLAVLSQWARFRSERDFWRYAETRLRPYFPHLPSRPQFNRQVRRQQATITAFALWLAPQLGADAAPYETLDGTAVPTRNAKRRGRGWLAGIADIGRCLRRGWIEGLRLLVSCHAGGEAGRGVRASRRGGSDYPNSALASGEAKTTSLTIAPDRQTTWPPPLRLRRQAAPVPGETMRSETQCKRRPATRPPT